LVTEKDGITLKNAKKIKELWRQKNNFKNVP
jgi:hypothetical protein